jgi:hypothetical protein
MVDTRIAYKLAIKISNHFDFLKINVAFQK